MYWTVVCFIYLSTAFKQGTFGQQMSVHAHIYRSTCITKTHVHRMQVIQSCLVCMRFHKTLRKLLLIWELNRETKMQSRNVTSYFYSFLILAHFKTYILETDTLIQKVKSHCQYSWNTPRLCHHLGFSLKTYVINKIRTECFLITVMFKRS